MSRILGISAYYHDSAAALMVDGRVVAAIQEERLSRVKHDAGFPRLAASECLRMSGLSSQTLDGVAFFEWPTRKFDRIVESHLAEVPRHFRTFQGAASNWLGWKLRLSNRIRRELRLPRHVTISYVDHHRAHAASAFWTSPFNEAAIVTVDAVGEWTTTAIHHGVGNQIQTLTHLSFPHSIGLLYSACTAFAGFEVSDGEYKLMGLAPTGEPRFVDALFEKVIRLCADGSYHINRAYIDVFSESTLVNHSLESLFGAKTRRPSEAIRGVDRDVAASIQAVTERVMKKIVAHALALTGCPKVCFAGGVCLNGVALGKLLDSSDVKDVWVQPAAGDSGCAMGAALDLHFQTHSQASVPVSYSPALPSPFDPRLGPAFGPDEILQSLQRHFPDVDFARVQQPNADADVIVPGIVYHPEPVDFIRDVASRLKSGQVVGWFDGRMEFGPRALGSRSILADARDHSMQDRLNAKVKHRESFRPFAPAVLADQASQWFEIDDAQRFPWMNLVVRVRQERRLEIPAVTHVDGTARLQTVDESMGAFHQLLLEFERQTQCPLLVNTSFNVAGEPIVCSPDDALQCFAHTELDMLALGGWIVDRRIFNEAPTWGAIQEASPILSHPSQEPFSQLISLARRIFTPVRRVVSGISIAGIYFGLMLPLAWMLRHSGYDPLGDRIGAPSSFWVKSQACQPRASSRLGVAGEFIQFLREERKWWLAPIFIASLILALLVAASTSPVAPFIYTLF